MKVSIQTLANKKYVLEVDEKDTVLALKNRIHSELSLGEVDEQKLIHLGKILKNEQELEASGVKNNSSIVLMLSKIKKAAPASAAAPAEAAAAGPSAVPAAQPAAAAAAATPTPAAAPATPTAAPAPAASDAPATPAASPATPSAGAGGAAPATPATPAASPPAGAAAQAESALAMGAGLEAMIEGLMQLGFPRDQVQLALRASFNNPDRAAEYLFNPEQLHAAVQQLGAGRPAPQAAGAPPAQSPAGGAQPQAGGGGAPSSDAQANALAQLMANAQGGAGGGGDAAGAIDPNNPLAGLAASPQFQQMRAMLQQQPQLIPLLLQQLAQREPALAQLIAQNPEALAELLAGGGAGGAGGAPPSGPRTHTIQITQEEKQQLDNLEALGFSRQRALEAWLLSDRNEMLAANYLFDHAGDDMEDDAAGGQQQGGGGAQ